MKKLTKEEVNPEIFDLYDDYAHNKIDRRLFMERLSIYAIGGLTVSSLMSFMMPNYKDTMLVAPDDERISSDYINYASPKGGGTIKGLLSKPNDASGKLPGIVVVHENRGLNPYIEDVGRRAAVDGFITLAPMHSLRLVVTPVMMMTVVLCRESVTVTKCWRTLLLLMTICATIKTVMVKLV